MGIWDDIRNYAEENVNTFVGLGSGNFGQARDSVTSSGVRAGQQTNLIEKQKKPEPVKAPPGPNEQAIASAAMNAQLESLKRQRASRTLFAGASLSGSAPSASPSASTSLLGF